MDLKWNEKISDGKFLGFEVHSAHCHYFFGSVHLTRDGMIDLFPEYDFKFLHQVHGNDLVPAQDGLPKADGHWTHQSGIALVVQTADCMPVLIGSKNLVIAVHAGWRGVESRILERAATILTEQRAEIERVLIGPHILAKEFEVGLDVAEKLATTHKLTGASGTVIFDHEDSSKKRVDLAQIARDQLHSALGRPLNIETSAVSTLTSPLFHSFRRGKAKEARQYSFIVLC